ncbi:MAG: DNA gyrase inhibitor YacG [Pyrinomonadaceae bacterium]|nr:DNA gyrase inhibitor YacG [Pyrinomonadaceae bacterium]MDQ3134401.1 DNA gyrase inhibitor YacG [Acidobacteriota bacterium]
MKCPNCDRPTTQKDNPYRPFCSERCKLIDFGNWVDENYAVPSDEAPPSEGGVQQRETQTSDERL